MRAARRAGWTDGNRRAGRAGEERPLRRSGGDIARGPRGVGARARVEHEWPWREAGGVRPGLLEPRCSAALAAPIAPALSARASRSARAGGRATGPRAARALCSQNGRAARRRGLEQRRRGGVDGASAGRGPHRLGRAGPSSGPEASKGTSEGGERGAQGMG